MNSSIRRSSAVLAIGALFLLLFGLPVSAAGFAVAAADGGSTAATGSDGSDTGTEGGIVTAPPIDSSIFAPDDSQKPGIEVLDLTGQGKEAEGSGNDEKPAGGQGIPAFKDDYIAGSTPSIITDRLPRFGYRFFSSPSGSFKPVANVPVGPDYLMGPGDTVRIDIWSLEEGHYTVPVDRNGNLSLPRAGVIGASGLTFGQVEKAIETAYSRYYSNFEINVTMGQLRSITVYVVGQSAKPGAYTLSSMSTVINALMASGGPSLAGSLRNIEVKRSGRTVSRFDAYDLLLKGDKKDDIRLTDGDIVFIPPVGPLAGITGNVKTPAYYEMKGPTRISDLIEMAGGFTTRYFKGRIQVDRTMGNEYRTSFESDLTGLKSDSAKDLALSNGDLVKIYAVSLQESKVYLAGAVARPGEYSIRIGETRISDVLRRAGGFLYMASANGELTRVKVTQDGPKTSRFKFDVPKAMADDPRNNMLLDINDYIMIRTVPDWNLYRTVKILGEVKYPGLYTIKKGERLSDLIDLAGGYTDEAFLPGATFTRPSVRDMQQKRVNTMIDQLEKQLYGASVEASGTSLSAEDARMTEIETRQRQAFLDKLKEAKVTGRVVVKIPDDPKLLKGSPYDIQLEQGDVLNIPKQPQAVHVVGSVYNPVSFIFRPDQPFTYYIKQAGGYTSNADIKRAYIVKADGTAVRAYISKKPIRVKDGDSIVVPEKMEVKAKLRNTRDIVDIIYKVAVGAAVLTN